MNFKLQEGEEILVNTKPSPLVIWYWLLGRIGTLIILFFVLVFFSINFDFFNMNSSYEVEAIVVVVFLAVVGLGYLWFWCIANGYHYIVTNQRVMIRYGFIVLNQRMIPLSQINDVNMRSTFFERMFGLGSVYIENLATLLGQGSFMMNAVSGLSSKSSLMNNTSRLEGLTYAQCDEIMNVVSAHIQKLRSNS